ncbi:YHYH protein [Lacinutrix sp. C3R15]|uniref:YHYH protein n=1 Tax=Flavobacteriaceae TaxID=49546 RepID=UPI001C099E4D|nr:MULTISPECIES: YHYH protein [Flavobacteriaceae]MBU2938569.1 YHYH protein [Lacinutrix sp. C3R15]MDO6621883.1 YHYH protein [Oceanihabitans sp. 1_MG-2023]
MSSKKIIWCATMLLSVFSYTGCTSEDDGINSYDVDLSDDIIQESYFNSTSLVSFEKIDCTLEDGSAGDCYQLVFTSNPVDNGPYCPTTINDVGGLGIYDGATNPGFQVMKASLFNAMEADGYDIVDDAGNIYIDDFNSGPVNQDYSYCLEAAPDNNLLLVFLIPATPVFASSNNTIDSVELIGVSVDGVPINGDPPSVANPGNEVAGNIPSLDPCGGHHDPAGYYHWHFVAETMNQVLEANGINDVTCTLVNQVSGSKLIGFAKDGFPIYAYQEEPANVDECGGITASTTEFPDGIYHYVASNTEAPNVPKCLKGVAATNNFRFQ